MTTPSDLAILPTSCRLCPRACGANRAAGKRGVCGADDTLVVARAALHEWEEPPISVGKGSGTVFFSHCPLRCVYCQNALIAHDGFGRTISLERLAQIFLELQEAGAANINLVTPTHYIPHIAAALPLARENGLVLPVVYNTSGYELAETIRTYAASIDVYLTDFKYWKAEESDAALRYSNAPDYFETAVLALDAMVQASGAPVFDEWNGQARLVRGVVVRHLVLPQRLEDSKHVMAYLWKRYGTSVLYSIMNQYTPIGSSAQFPELSYTVPNSDYHALLDYCDELGMSDYYWQSGPAASESFIPPFDTTGV